MARMDNYLKKYSCEERRNGVLFGEYVAFST